MRLCSIIAIHGMDGHAYDSWRGGNLGRMWLRDFLSKDMPCCRTMIYGYNAKLSSRGIDTILDYSRGFLEEIKNVRRGKEVNLAFRDSRLSMTRDCSKLFVDYTISCLSRQRIPAPFLYCARFRQELHLHRAGKNATAFLYHT